MFTLLKMSRSSPIGLAGSHQYTNAALAVTLAKTFLELQTEYFSDPPLPEVFKSALSNTKWPGRCQTVSDPDHGRTTWFLDGAHTHESLECCMEWFISPDVALRPR